MSRLRRGLPAAARERDEAERCERREGSGAVRRGGGAAPARVLQDGGRLVSRRRRRIAAGCRRLGGSGLLALRARLDVLEIGGRGGRGLERPVSRDERDRPWAKLVSPALTELIEAARPLDRVDGKGPSPSEQVAVTLLALRLLERDLDALRRDEVKLLLRPAAAK